ncbi:MAG: arginase family protein [Kofleriaceae bacterium]|nr:arginase family protein [Myxococcales bacterium]MCB9562051.1 arginase family protein [Kofleriaceae bacterium]
MTRTLRMSSFTRIVDDADGRRALVNLYTNERVALDPELERALPRVLEVDLDEPRASGERLLWQLCGYELASRGILVPRDADSERVERRFLDSLRALVDAPPFFGVPRATSDELAGVPAIAFLGVRSAEGASYPGTASGPELLRRASRRLVGDRGQPRDLVDGRGHRPFDGPAVVDLGDVDLRRRDLDAWLDAVEAIVAALPATSRPVVVGGDHAMTYPVVKALYQRRGGRPFTLIQFDQHLDLQVRGELIGGRPRHHEPITHANFVSHVLALDPAMRVVQVGGAPYHSVPIANDAGWQQVRRDAVTQLSVLDIAAAGVDAIIRRLACDQDVYVTIDVDVLAAPTVRATGYPAPLGLDPALLFRLIEAAIVGNRVLGVDLMEFGVAPPQAGPATEVEADLLALLLCHVVSSLGPQLAR